MKRFALVCCAASFAFQARAADQFAMSVLDVTRTVRGPIAESSSRARKVDLRPGGNVFMCSGSVKWRLGDGIFAGASASCRRRSVQGTPPKEGRTYVISDRSAVSNAEDGSFWRLEPATGETAFCAHIAQGSATERFYCVDAADSSL